MAKISFLIIDDSEEDRYLLKRRLKKIYPDLIVFEAEDGAKAIDFLKDYNQKKQELGKDFPPIISFLDINMPLMNGFEFLEKFRPIKDSVPKYAPCVFMMFSSSESESDKEKALSYDFVKNFIVKGKDSVEDIKSKIEEALKS